MHTEPRSFATETAGGRAPNGHFWWGRLVSEELYRGLIRDVEAAKGQLSAHERECAERYRRIEDHTSNIKDDVGDLKATIGSVQSSLQALEQRGEAAAWAANWRAWSALIAMLALLLSWGVWAGAQLYQLEPVRVKHEAKK